MARPNMIEKILNTSMQAMALLFNDITEAFYQYNDVIVGAEIKRNLRDVSILQMPIEQRYSELYKAISSIKDEEVKGEMFKKLEELNEQKTTVLNAIGEIKRFFSKFNLSEEEKENFHELMQKVEYGMYDLCMARLDNKEYVNARRIIASTHPELIQDLMIIDPKDETMIMFFPEYIREEMEKIIQASQLMSPSIPLDRSEVESVAFSVVQDDGLEASFFEIEGVSKELAQQFMENAAKTSIKLTCALEENPATEKYTLVIHAGENEEQDAILKEVTRIMAQSAMAITIPTQEMAAKDGSLYKIDFGETAQKKMRHLNKETENIKEALLSSGENDSDHVGKIFFVSPKASDKNVRKYIDLWGGENPRYQKNYNNSIGMMIYASQNPRYQSELKVEIARQKETPVFISDTELSRIDSDSEAIYKMFRNKLSSMEDGLSEEEKAAQIIMWAQKEAMDLQMKIFEAKRRKENHPEYLQDRLFYKTIEKTVDKFGIRIGVDEIRDRRTALEVDKHIFKSNIFTREAVKAEELISAFRVFMARKVADELDIKNFMHAPLPNEPKTQSQVGPDTVNVILQNIRSRGYEEMKKEFMSSPYFAVCARSCPNPSELLDKYYKDIFTENMRSAETEIASGITFSMSSKMNLEETKTMASRAANYNLNRVLKEADELRKAYDEIKRSVNGRPEKGKEKQKGSIAR